MSRALSEEIEKPKPKPRRINKKEMSSSLVGDQESENLHLHLHATTCFFLLLFSLLLAALYLKNKQSRGRRPPGPLRIPIIGNLHQLGALPHHNLHRLSRIYGPLMHLQLGHIPTLIISNSAYAREILKTHDLVFCSRPKLTTWQKLSYGGLDLAFAPYTEYWTQMRKVSAVEFFSSKRLQLLQSMREEEVRTMVHNIVQAVSAHGGAAAVNLSDMFLCLLSNMTCRALFGKRYAAEGECRKSELGEMITETVELMGGFVAGDFYPCMQYWLNLITGVQAKLEKNFKEMDEFLDREVKERERDGGGTGSDFASVLVRLRTDASIALTRDHIKAILLTTFIAGTDTTAVSLAWAMTEIMKNPSVLAKAQEEVRRVAKGKDHIEERDLEQLKYLNAIVKETHRLRPPGPLLLPRESRENCQIDGYHIPAGTRVYINAWAIGRDPDVWANAEEFVPERFEENCFEYKAHFQFVPFGGGRRMCPGIAIAGTTMALALANLLRRFNWALPDGKSEDIDVSESFGIVVSKKVPLILVATQAK